MVGLHPWQNEINVLSSLSPSMRITENETLSDWQEAARKKLRELLGLAYFHRCEDLFRIENTQKKGCWTETRFVFQTEQGYFVPCIFVKPKKPRSSPPPVMICLQGHSTGMHNSFGITKYPGDRGGEENGDRDFAVQCAKLGLCAVTVEQRCFGNAAARRSPTAIPRR